MSFSKNDNDQFKKDLKNNGWKQSAYSENTWLKGYNRVTQSASEGSWNNNGSKYTDYSNAKKSNRF